MENKKIEIRKDYISLRNGLKKSEISEKSKAVIKNILSTNTYKAAKTVMVYNAFGSEVDLSSLPLYKESRVKRFVYPVCVSNTDIKAYLPGKMRKGAFGIIEPDPEMSTFVPSEEIDFIICPGVAFDTNFNRLGMGGGYYDRFLPRCKNAVCCMVAFELQKCDSLPAERFDRKMDFIVTENEIYK